MSTSKWNRPTVRIRRFRCIRSFIEETRSATIRRQVMTHRPTVVMDFVRISALVRSSMTPTRVDRTTVQARSSLNTRTMMTTTKRHLLERDSVSSAVTLLPVFTMALLLVRRARLSSSEQFKVGQSKAAKRVTSLTLDSLHFLRDCSSQIYSGCLLLCSSVFLSLCFFYLRVRCRKWRLTKVYLAW